MKVLDFTPFHGLYTREFELSHSNLVNRIIKITHAHNLHVKMLDFVPFKICMRKNAYCLPDYFAQTMLTISSFSNICNKIIFHSKHVSDIVALKLPESEFKGLLNFVRERIKHVYRIIFIRYSFKKAALVQASKNTITHTSKLKSISKYQLLTFHL